MAAVSAGYEPEARVLDRVLIELSTHRDRIQGDPSGEEGDCGLRVRLVEVSPRR